MQERKHSRFAVQLPVLFSGDGLNGSGTILNLSQQGCAITSEVPAETGVYLGLSMRLREQEEPVQIEVAAVRWSAAARFGVEFIKLRFEAGERLKQFVKMLESRT